MSQELAIFSNQSNNLRPHDNIFVSQELAIFSNQSNNLRPHDKNLCVTGACQTASSLPAADLSWGGQLTGGGEMENI